MRASCLMLFLCSFIPTVLIAGDDSKPPQEQEKQPALFFKLKPSLITNVHGAASYVRCDIQLMTRGEDKLEQIALHEPALRHELLMLLGDQQGKLVKTTKGKEKLRKSALKAVNGVLGEMACKECVNDLYFTSFFVQ